jgi:hypothetical protein
LLQLETKLGTFVIGERSAFDFKNTNFSFARDKMIYRAVAVILAGSLVVGAAVAQSTAPSNEKQETSCTTSSAATSGSAGEKTSNSMAMEKSAILPDAGGSNSAAPTVQSGGEPMIVRSDCPPDSKPK